MKEFQDLFEDLFLLDDTMDKYDFIMDYGNNANSVKDFDYQDFELVPGCTSRLWIRYTNKDFICKADSAIVKGIAGMICDWYNQASIEQRENFSLQTLEKIGLAPILSMGRQNGVANLIKRIKYIEYWGNKNSPN